MTDEVITTPEVVENKPEDAQPEKNEKTIGEVLNPDQPKEEKPTVGLDKFLEIKKENKEMARRLKELESKISSGSDADEISSDIKELADEFDVDPKFLSKLEKTIKSTSEKEIENRLKPLTEKENQERLNKIFNTHFEKTIAEMPEYAEIVNPEVIKQLSLNPSNGKKTFAQLIEETYGNALGGKRTIETYKPTGRNEPEPLDFDRARKDTAYFSEIMKNPKLKAEYNDALLKKGL